MTFRAVPKPPNREFQLLERAAAPEREAAQARVRLAADARAEAAAPHKRDPNLIQRAIRKARGRKS